MAQVESSAVDTYVTNKFIIPPGLISCVMTFKSHIHVANGEPILIVGDTGVGKSLFLHIFDKIWKKEHPDTPCLWVNCAHFGGPGSDPNVARSELFGYNASFFAPGSTNRIISKKDIVGLVEQAKGGTLILEEIGELPLEVQAMLLTFIETGKYRRVGDTQGEDRHADVTIVGATNREGALREDFRFRFFPFYVPPIYKRRGDILYYLYNRFPALTKTLSPFEILSLLSHNWPGNVREIERVGLLIERRKKMVKYIPGAKGIEGVVLSDPDRLLLLELNDTTIGANKISRYYSDMCKKGGNTEQYNSLLRRFGVGISSDTKRLPFASLQTIETEADDDISDVMLLKSNRLFSRALTGYRLMCSILYQYSEADYNPFDLKGDGSLEIYFTQSEYHEIDEKTANLYDKLMVDSFKQFSGLELPSNTQFPIELDKRIELFNNLLKYHPQNRFLASFNELDKPDEEVSSVSSGIFTMSFDDFMKYYYTKLIESTGGNVAEAARRTQVNYQTLQTRIKSYGVKI